MLEHHFLPDHQQWLPHEPLRHFASTAESAEYFSEIFVAHTVESLAPRSALNLFVRSRWFQGCGLLVLDYGVPVRITPQKLDDFFLIQIPISGSAQLRVGDHEFTSTPQRASLPPTHEPSVITWHDASPHVLLYLPRQLLEDNAKTLYGLDSAAGLRLSTSLELTTDAGRKFMAALKNFHDDLINTVEESAQQSVIARTSLDLLALRLLAAVDHTFSTASFSSASQPTTAEQFGSPASLAHRFIALLRSHATEDVAIADFAERLGVSTRTLQAATAQTFQRTPGQLIRSERLRAAYLLLCDPTQHRRSVSEIALSCGFEHFGRFSTAYKQRFGESPSTTKARSST